jgi:hypothetical protein
VNCHQGSQGLLEADLHELEGVGESPLAVHIRDCPKCRAMAQAIVEDHRLLARGLQESVSGPDLGLLVDGFLAQEKGAVDGDDAKARSPFRRFGPYLIPLAAAATLAGLFFGGNPSLPGDPYLLPQRVEGLDLEVADGGDVAVLATDNPDITVLWFF